MTKDGMVKLLMMSEKGRASIPINMAKIKAERIMDELKKEANEKIKSRWFKTYNAIMKENKK